jgi:hypothetical protein
MSDARDIEDQCSDADNFWRHITKPRRRLDRWTILDNSNQHDSFEGACF